MRLPVEETNWRNELRVLWPILHARSSEGEIASYPLPLRSATGPMRVAVDRAGVHHLLVPLAPGETVEEDLRSQHVRLERRVLELDGRTSMFFDISCNRRDVHDVFDEALAAMLDQVARSPVSMVATCTKVWDDWRLLLQGRTELLGEAALRGLFAELPVLHRILDRLGPLLLPSVWKGPDRAPHDFRVGDDAIEVKALGPRGSKVRIHGLGQLEPPAGGRLYLALVRLEKETRSGRSLPELVDEVRRRATDGAGLTVQLAKAGYYDAHSDAYRDERYVTTQTVFLPVPEGFPRIVPSSFSDAVPAEVDEVSYAVDLASQIPDALSVVEFDEVLGLGG